MAKLNKLKRAVIKEELVAMINNKLSENGESTSNSYKYAILLNQGLYWAERVGHKRYKKWLEEESLRSIDDEENLEGGWIYKKSEGWVEDCLLEVSERTMRRWLKKLVKMGYFFERDNPKIKFDHTKQYRINLLKVIYELDELDYHLEGYKTAKLLNRHNVGRDKHNDDSDKHNDGTIPESTTENTTENTVSKCNSLTYEDEMDILEEADKQENEPNRKTEPSKIRQAMENIWKMNNYNPNQLMKLRGFVKQLSEELVVEAMKKSQYKGDPFSYCCGSTKKPDGGILNEWLREGVKNIEDVKKLDKEHGNSKSKKVSNPTSVRRR